MRFTLLAALAALASACSPLTAEAPLFSPADQDGQFTLAQGWWVGADPDCKVNPARSRPERKTCLEWARIVREADGRWLLSMAPGEGDDDDGPLRVVLVPAVVSRVGPAPLYLAEATNTKTGVIMFGGVIARGARGPDNTVRRFALAPVTCDVVEATGGVPGVELVRNEEGRVTSCIARTKDGALETTRRAALDALPEIGENDLVFVRP